MPNTGHYAEPPEAYTTRNNRLTRYEEYADLDSDPVTPDVLTRTVWYVYYKTGNVSNIVVKDHYTGSGTAGDYDWYRDMAFYYTTSGQVWQVLWDRWKADSGQTPPPDVDELPAYANYEPLAAREFRYDSPRARYLSRPVDPDYFTPDALSTWEWTDYDGVQPYGDFSVALDGEDNPVATNVTRFFAANTAQQTVAGGAIQYNHGDLIASTVATSDAAGDAAATTAYTAFGERIPGAAEEPHDECDTRYGYAGGWGYESGLLTLEGAPGTQPITLQHLGARWYQPGIGRFVQRDPAGLLGGQNVYLYACANPLACTDPNGMFDWVRGLITGLGAGLVGTLSGGPVIGLAAAGAGFVIGGMEDEGNPLETAWDIGSGMSDHPLLICVSLPLAGRPCSSGVRGDWNDGQIRSWGPNGLAQTDIDFGHPHHHPGIGSPHCHDWDHSGPTPQRGPARPPRPGESWY